jgi:hypothetical protein
MSDAEMLLSVQLKKCSRCKEIKSTSLFSKNSSTTDKLQYECRNL